MSTALTYAVVTPVRDEADNVRRLAACLAAQTCLPTTWLVVDDGSSDGTLELVEEQAAPAAGNAHDRRLGLLSFLTPRPPKRVRGGIA